MGGKYIEFSRQFAFHLNIQVIDGCARKPAHVDDNDYMVEKTDQLWKGPPNLTMVFLLINFKICTENGQIKTTKTGVNKDLVLGDNYT